MANFKENKKYHYIYKTTNLINGRYYLGMHSTNRIDDRYLGSGKRLYYELNKYGRDNFKFEILEQFDSREELVQAEINLITEQDLKNPNCLNCKPGGIGFSTESSTVANNRKQELLDYNPDWKKQYSDKLSKAIREANSKLTDEDLRHISEKIKQGQRRVNFNHATFKGKKHSEETKKKIGTANSSKQRGANNSQFGKCWITNETENKKIHKGDLIPEGWRLGRKIK